MFDSKQSQMHALECLRMAADCLQLSRDVHSDKLQAHFVQMAEAWSTLATSELDASSGREVSEVEILPI
jgi:hypothetical protein